MTQPATWLCLLPPALTIALALMTRRVLPSLFAGVLAGHVILTFPHIERSPFAALDQLLGVAANRDNMIILTFSVVVGGLLALIRAGHGFEAFAAAIERLRHGFGRRTAFGITAVIGTGLFLDNWSNVLVNGATSAPLYDRLGISRARLAYFAHMISQCVVAMAVINGWGAFYMGLLSAQGVAQPFSFIVGSIPFMLYNWIGLAVVGVVMATGWSLGPMRAFDAEATRMLADSRETGGQARADDGVKPRAIYMVAPILTLLATVFIALYVTGKGRILDGDGGLSILYAAVAASVVAGGLLLAYRAFRPAEVEQRFVDGMTGFFDIALLIVLALAIGDLTLTLGTGTYIAGFVTDAFPTFLAPALVFLVGALMSFATGTSYGTYAIVTPIALPIAALLGTDPMLMFGAVISGGLFGDIASPISDTTIMTAIGVEMPVIDHARTQLPYALVTAVLATLGFVILGVVM